MRGCLLSSIFVAITGCSLIVPGSGDFLYGHPDAGTDASVADAGTADAGCPDMCGSVCTDLRTDPTHCGSCDRSCSEPVNGFATCADRVCDFRCDPGYARVVGSCVEREAPRPIAPLSTASVTSRRPTLRWELAARSDGARVQLCEDRACAIVLQTVDASGTSGRPPSDLPPGVIFWRMLSLAEGVPGTVVSATWQFYVPARSADIADTSWGTTLDVDGDGFADVAIGAPEAFTGDGRAYLYTGAASGLMTTPTPLQGEATARQFGSALSSAGDVNGDGFGDLLVGAYRESSDSGAIYLFFGGPGGLNTTPQRVAASVSGGWLGFAVSGAGDVNADGFADVLVGAYRETSQDGAAYLFRGSPDGLDTTLAPQRLAGAIGGGGRFGTSLASAGDLDGDGFGDVVVGADNEVAGDGAAYVYYGGTTGLASSPEPPGGLRGPAGTSTNFGDSAAAADINGDGYADLAVTAPDDASAVGFLWIFSGGDTGLAVTPTPIASAIGVGGRFGEWVSPAGDADGDGFEDLVLGASGVGTSDGAIILFFGGEGGLAAGPQQRDGAPGADSAFGVCVQGAGDVDRDGFDDLLVGAPWGNTFNGAAHLYRGGPTGITAAPQPTLPSPDGGRFGGAVAL